MELLAALGFRAKELFNYNRENFKFDQDQRLEREALRLEMQVKRYELFREDVRDLVELTVDRMDVYHLVGSLFLEFCIVLFCEGRIQASAPPFVLSLFLLSNACSFIYLLIAVWLSMHASIASHSFGVRLLTRFVRLPIPSMKQLSQLRSQLRDYERQGVVNLLRLPFLNKSEQVWKQAEDVQAPAGSSDSPSASPEVQPPPPASRGPRPSAKAFGPPASAASPHPAATAARAQGPQEESLLPDVAEAPIGGEDLLSGAAGAAPERHVQLFRQLQSKWQCYDAYCRVCMGLGVNQMLQSLSYYAVAHTLIENRSPTTGYALVVLFQSTTVALAVLDLAGMKRREIIAIQVLGMLPVIIAASELSRPTARDPEGNLVQDHRYVTSPLCFLFQVVWLELWRLVAMPDSAKSQLPRRFRQVLFLDVFGDASAWGAEGAEASRDKEEDPAEEAPAEIDYTSAATDTAQRAATQLLLAQWAVRRWVAAPDWAVSQLQRSMLQQLRKRLSNAGRTIQAQLDCCRTAGVSCGDLVDGCSGKELFEEQLRAWRDLSEEEKRADPFAECLLGPFEHDSGYQASSYHYNLENQCCHFEAVPDSARILTIDGVEAIVQDLEREERELLSARMLADFEQVRAEQHSFSSSFEHRRSEPRKTLTAAQLEKAARAAKESFPNLSNMLGAGSEASEEDSNDLKRALVISPGRPGRGSRRETQIELNSRSTATLADAAPAGAAAEGAEDVPKGPPRKSVASPFLPQDATLQAMAGEHAEHFVPERLPWQVVSSMTRVLQLCWLWSGAFFFLKVCNIYQADFQHHAGGERRLCASGGQLSFESLPVDWPRGALFHPQGVYRVPTLAFGDGLIMSSPYAFYQASPGDGPLGWQELLRSRTPPSTALLCPAPEQQQPSGDSVTAPAAAPRRHQRRQVATGAGSCLLAAPSGAGRRLTFWSFGDDPQLGAQALQVEGSPWRLMTGAVVDCEAVWHLASPERLAHGAGRCALIVGWDGASLPIVVHPLEEDTRGVLLPSAESSLQHEVDAPLGSEDAERGVVALHLEPQSSRLWVLLSSGALLGWDLLTSRGLGTWELRWPEGSGGFQPVSFCEDVEDGSVLVLGRSKALGPLLLRAAWPSAL